MFERALSLRTAVASGLTRELVRESARTCDRSLSGTY